MKYHRKVKIFNETSVEQLEKEMNLFLATLNENQLIDIKLSSSSSHTALVLYTYYE